MMSRRLLIINVGLAIVVVWGGFRIRQAWQAFGETHNAAAVRPESAGIMPQPVAPPAAVPVQVEWSEAAARNPFSFDRNDMNHVVEAQPASNVQQSPVPILYGVMSLGGPPVAILGDANRRSPGTKVGETFAGWTLMEINDKGVVVASNGRQETLIKGTVPRDRGEPIRTAAAPDRTIVNSVGQPAVATPATSGNAYNLNLNPSIPVVPPKGTVVEYTPFGNRLVQAP